MENFLTEANLARPDLVEPSTYRSRLVAGLPATRIVEVAEQENAQLIVVGSLGRTALQRIMMGPKAQRVAQLSPVPVTIVKQPGFGEPAQ